MKKKLAFLMACMMILMTSCNENKPETTDISDTTAIDIISTDENSKTASVSENTVSETTENIWVSSIVKIPIDAKKVCFAATEQDMIDYNDYDVCVRTTTFTNEDIIELSKLTHLTHLYLNSYDEIDLSPLKSLENLEMLNIYVEQYNGDISFLENMKKLKQLSISASNIKDFSFIGELHELEMLGLSQVMLNDISFLENLKDLKSFAIVTNYGQIDDYSVLNSLYSLERLHLNNVNVDTLDLSNLINLKELFLRGVNNCNTQSIGKLKTLEQIEIIQSNQDNFDFLAYLPNLKKLRIDESNLTDASFIQTLRTLEELSLYETKISNIEFLSSLSNLKILDLSYTKIDNIYPIKDMTSVEKLDLSGCEITNIIGVNNLSSLKEINIYCTNVDDISPLYNISTLETIHLSQFCDVNQVSLLTSLKTIYSGSKKLNEVEVFNLNSALPECSIIWWYKKWVILTNSIVTNAVGYKTFSPTYINSAISAYNNKSTYYNIFFNLT